MSYKKLIKAFDSWNCGRLKYSTNLIDPSLYLIYISLKDFLEFSDLVSFSKLALWGYAFDDFLDSNVEKKSSKEVFFCIKDLLKVIKREKIISKDILVKILKEIIYQIENNNKKTYSLFVDELAKFISFSLITLHKLEYRNVDEYLKYASRTIFVPTLVLYAFFLADIQIKSKIELVKKIKDLGVCCRLVNDLVTYSREKKEEQGNILHFKGFSSKKVFKMLKSQERNLLQYSSKSYINELVKSFYSNYKALYLIEDIRNLKVPNER